MDATAASGFTARASSLVSRNTPQRHLNSSWSRSGVCMNSIKANGHCRTAYGGDDSLANGRAYATAEAAIRAESCNQSGAQSLEFLAQAAGAGEFWRKRM
jgi:hypothetical protein